MERPSFFIGLKTLVATTLAYWRRKTHKRAIQPSPPEARTPTIDDFMCIDCGDKTITISGGVTIIATRKNQSPPRHQ